MKLNPLVKNFIAAILIFIAIGGIFTLVYTPAEKIDQISISQLVGDINSEKVKKITVSGDEIEVFYHDDKKALSMKESNSVLPELLTSLGADNEKLKKVE